MKELWFASRAQVIRFGYYHIAKPIFFKLDPEYIHHKMIGMGKLLGSFWFGRFATRLLFSYEHVALEQTVLGIRFKNPIGLSAGFDKDAQILPIIKEVGFGFEEAGSITALPCAGNPKPRMWRLKQTKSLVIHYGLNNKGAKIIAQKLRGKKFDMPLGISIAKTNCKETADMHAGVADYIAGAKAFLDIGDYMTLNVSCPNAYGGEPFHDPESLELLLTAFEKLAYTKPVFVKISPDLAFAQVDAILDVLMRHKIRGIVCGNLTKDRSDPSILEKKEEIPTQGGLSGTPTRKRSTDMIRHVYERTHGKLVIVGVGGIASAQDAYEKIKAGATLLEMITGMIFEGPQVVGEINQGLVALLKRDGYKNISEAVGKDVRIKLAEA
jgi:dihydroorotate dehydrogenase